MVLLAGEVHVVHAYDRESPIVYSFTLRCMFLRLDANLAPIPLREMGLAMSFEFFRRGGGVYVAVVVLGCTASSSSIDLYAPDPLSLPVFSVSRNYDLRISGWCQHSIESYKCFSRYMSCPIKGCPHGVVLLCALLFRSTHTPK